MFYSHEILLSTRNGVATIWRVATVDGDTTNRKPNRKTIQDVNVEGACTKVTEPAAPIALRLQGNLLVGIARVFSHHCNYVLSDASKFRTGLKISDPASKNASDAEAGKMKFWQITLPNDPTFDINAPIPGYKFDIEAMAASTSPNAAKASSKQKAPKASSKMSPMTSGSSSGRLAYIREIPYLPPHDPSCVYRRPFLTEPTATHIDPFTGLYMGPEINDPVSDLGIQFDNTGDLLPEPQLPVLPQEQRLPVFPGMEVTQTLKQHEDVHMIPEDQLPEAEALPARPGDATVAQGVPVTRQLRPRTDAVVFKKDAQLRISHKVYTGYKHSYLKDMAAQAKIPIKPKRGAVKKKAFTRVFGSGIGSVGRRQSAGDIEHPLSQHFSGNGLRTALGLTDKGNQTHGPSSGNRRSANQAFGPQDETKRVRQKRDGGHVEQHLDEFLLPMEETGPETGMDRARALDDHRMSSSILPHRQSSVVPGSGQKPSGLRVSASPLLGARVGIAQPIERFSDSIDPGLGLHSHDTSMMDVDTDQSRSIVLEQGNQSGSDKKPMKTYLEHVRAKAAAEGRFHIGDPKPFRKWITFDQLAKPHIDTKKEGANCFFNVLEMASKNQAIVYQEEARRMEPFGNICISVDVNSREINRRRGLKRT